MTAPMMRARLNGGPCHVPGHGSRCERVDDRQPVARAREKRAWQREVRALLPPVQSGMAGQGVTGCSTEETTTATSDP